MFELSPLTNSSMNIEKIKSYIFKTRFIYHKVRIYNLRFLHEGIARSKHALYTSSDQDFKRYIERLS